MEKNFHTSFMAATSTNQTHRRCYREKFEAGASEWMHNYGYISPPHPFPKQRQAKTICLSLIHQLWSSILLTKADADLNHM